MLGASKLVLSARLIMGSGPPPPNRQHRSSVACLEDKREDNQNCFVLFCTTFVHNDTHTREQFLHFCILVRFRFLLVCLFRFCLLCVLRSSYSCVACFCCAGFSFFSTPKDWLERTSQSAQTRTTQFYLQITQCLPFLRKRSPDGATPNLR